MTFWKSDNVDLMKQISGGIKQGVGGWGGAAVGVSVMKDGGWRSEAAIMYNLSSSSPETSLTVNRSQLLTREAAAAAFQKPQ